MRGYVHNEDERIFQRGDKAIVYFWFSPPAKVVVIKDLGQWLYVEETTSGAKYEVLKEYCVLEEEK